MVTAGQGARGAVPSPGNVVAIGVFDGVHRGHRLLLDRALEAGRELRLPVLAVTFHPHPAVVVHPASAPLMLTTIERRSALLREAGADEVVVLAFTPEMSQLSPERFAGEVLTDRLAARRVVVGADWRFGHKAAGDVAALRELGYDVDAVDLLGDGEQVVSSSHVRALVAAGDVSAAAAALGRPHLVEGPVVRGDARGHELGYPTANVAVDAGIAVPADGVYAGHLVRASSQRLPAAISIGTNPTFDGVDGRRVEAYVLDAEAGLDLYDEHVAVELERWLRGMVRFDDVASLVAQMATDVDRTRDALG